MNPNPYMDEQDAVRRLKCGDLAGLECLVRRYQVSAVHSAYLVCGDPALAEDVAQAAFLQAARKIKQFDERRPFQPWFLQIVVRLAIREARRGQRSVPLDEPGEAAPRWLVDGGPQPGELAERSELRAGVWQAIQALPPEERAVIVQRHFLEMSAAEMTAKGQTCVFALFDRGASPGGLAAIPFRTGNKPCKQRFTLIQTHGGQMAGRPIPALRRPPGETVLVAAQRWTSTICVP